MLQIQSFLGIFVFLGLAWCFSSNRKKISWQIVATGLGLQVILALFILGIPSLGIAGPLKFIFEYANIGINAVLNFTDEGSRFLFSWLIDPEKSGMIIAFKVLPIIVFLSSLMTILYHIGIMQWIVKGFALVMHKLLKISGVEALATAANVFIGQTEAPLVVRPFLAKMTRSELFTLMVGGMATIAGSVMAAYVSMLRDMIPNIAGHLLTASVISAPAALMIAKIMIPETEKPETFGRVPKNMKSENVNVIEAAANGATEGVKLAINVAAMLLAFIALIAMGDAILSGIGNLIGFNEWGRNFSPEFLIVEGQAKLSLSLILSWLFTPIAFFLGIPWADVAMAGSLLGKKVAFNEFIAYLDLAKLGAQMTPRAQIILSYALCGFANFSSIAIQIGGIGSLVPERKSELAQLGIQAVIGGSLAAFITAAIAGILV